MLSRLRRLAQNLLLDPEQRAALDYARMRAEYDRFQCLETAIQFACWNSVPGDYLEFGCYTGKTFAAAHHLFEKYRGYVAQTLEGEHLAAHRAARPRLFAFDSFEGLPPPGPLDGHAYAPKHWVEHTFTMPRHSFEAALRRDGVDMDNVTVIEGYFDRSLTPETRAVHKMQRVCVANIDCDFYESTVHCLEFITPLIQDGTVLLFDDYNFYRGAPNLGERRAFSEWLAANPQVTATEFAHQGYDKVAFFLTVRAEAETGRAAVAE